MPTFPRTSEKGYSLLMVLAILVNFSGLFVTVMGPDGVLYASIAKTMAQTGNFTELFAEGKDWLDKPHFPFWVTALSFRLFGFETWAYKLPAILFLMMGAGYTWLLARDLYGREVAGWAVLILLTAEHIIISNNDVRAEPYLTGAIVASVFHFHRARRGGFGHLAAGALFAAIAVMTKGPFSLIPIGGAIAGELAIKRNWRELLHPRWWLAALLVLLFITPELYCLYVQFDAQPQKVVFGRTGVSGIRFFFWDSQFGRFLNTGPIKGKGDPSFYLHTVLWAFLPWSVLLYAAVVQKIRQGRKAVRETEWYTVSGALLCFLVFSLSRFQLPHYLNILFPFFAILTAQYVLTLQKAGGQRFVRVTQTVITILLPVFAVVLHVLFQPGHTAALVALIITTVALALILRPVVVKGAAVRHVLARTVFATVIVNFYLNLVFYPALMCYQSGSEAAFVANQRYPALQVVQLGEFDYGLNFYLRNDSRGIAQLSDTALIAERPVLLYADQRAVEGTGFRLVQDFDHFRVSRLTFKRVFHRTRAADVQHYGLFLLEK